MRNRSLPSLSCGHADADPRSLCAHMPRVVTPVGNASYYKGFTGKGYDYWLLCSNCAKLPVEVWSNPALVCAQCFKALEKDCDDYHYLGHRGNPEALVAPRQKSLESRLLRYSQLNAHIIADIQPIYRSDNPHDRWLALTAQGRLVRIAEGSNFVEASASLGGPVDYALPLLMRLSENERFLAVANTYGVTGCVIDLENNKVCLELKRDDYHIEQNIYPLAFFEHDGRQLLVHGTEWNRLDISDPLTGKCLTAREHPIKDADSKERPPHALDYFHGILDVAPGNKFILGNGWVWHPVGIPTVWSLTDWVSRNVWESEDGPSRHQLFVQEYSWPTPACWVNERTVALLGDDELPGIAVSFYDAATGERSRWFTGAGYGELFFDQHLFISGSEGLTAWNPETGERVLDAPTFRPTRYRRDTKEFLQILPDNILKIGRLKE